MHSQYCILFCFSRGSAPRAPCLLNLSLPLFIMGLLRNSREILCPENINHFLKETTENNTCVDIYRLYVATTLTLSACLELDEKALLRTKLFSYLKKRYFDGDED